MKKKLLCLLLLISIISAAASAQETDDLIGQWHWPEPEYMDGVMGVSGYLDYTLSVTETKGSVQYNLADENGTTLHSGSCRIDDGLLHFRTGTGELIRYTITDNGNGTYELCEYHDYPSQNVYFTISNKEGDRSSPEPGSGRRDAGNK